MTNHKSHSPDQWERIAEDLFNGIYHLIKIFYAGIGEFFRFIQTKYFEFIFVTVPTCTLLTFTQWDLKLIFNFFPNRFGKGIVQLVWGGSNPTHFLHLFTTEFAILCFILGLKVIRNKNKWNTFFETISLKNGIGGYPTLLKTSSLNEFQKCFIFQSSGIGVEQFQNKKSALESMIKLEIETITIGTNPSIIKIITNSKRLPFFLNFESAKEQLDLSQGEFILGDSKQGLKKANLTKLPHLLIAGTTGGGKSVFFKQTLLGLLTSSKNIEMNLIDLKGGLEFSDFKCFSNVSIVKSINHAANLLQKIESEMMKRFDYLEKTHRKEIMPERDQMPRIIIAVDEASVLYANMDKYSDDYEDSIVARNLTDKIAKLGRAAAIHLILATQKVSKETISTSIQENISARMCFQMNTLPGSLALLGDKRAIDLPAIAGRGIWSHGNDSFEVQVPFVDERTIRSSITSSNLEPVKVQNQPSNKSKLQDILSIGEQHE